MSEVDPRIAFFDQHAANWDSEGPPIEQTLKRLDGLEPDLDLQAGWDVLEVGCGTGAVTSWLADHVKPGRVTAADFSPAMIAKCNERGVDATFRCVDVCADDLGEAAYDLIWCMHCFPHMRDQSAALANMARACKPSGQFIVLHLDSWSKINEFHAGVGGHVASDLLPEPDKWPALLAKAGFTQTKLVDRDDLFLLVATRT